MSFANASEIIKFEYWLEPEFSGEQWGIGVHDLDGNGYLDFYANHHGQPTGEIIMNFASGSPTNIHYEIPGDLHGVSFFDIDQDGDADLLQAQGGRGGTASDPNDPSLFSRVLLNDAGTLSTTNSAADFGVAYPLGRKRLLTPVNFDGELAIYVGVLNNREAGDYPGDFFERRPSGSYALISPFGGAISGEIAKGVHFGTDRFVDIINLDWMAREVRVVENNGEGFGAATTLSTGRSQITDVVTGDFDGDLGAEILVGRAGRSDSVFKRDATGRWVEAAAATPTFVKTTNVMAAGDLDNDGDIDYAALKRQDGVEVVSYLNRGDGTFTTGSRFLNSSIAGRGEFMISGDFNRDGALDLIITTSSSDGGPEGPVDGVYVLLEGDATENNWLSIQLKGVVSETGGLGARVYVTTPDGKVQLREQESGAHFTSQNSTDLHFGLGDHETASVRIVWPDGYEQRIDGVTLNRHVVLTEDRDEPSEPDAGPDIVGTSIADRLIGTALAERLFGHDGGDKISALQGADKLFGGRGTDKLLGGPDDDVLRGGAGRDGLRSGSSDDRLFGGEGRDRLRGGSGDDRLFGGEGRDRLRGGGGEDVLVGGFGPDVLIFAGDFGSDNVLRFDARSAGGQDLISLRAFELSAASFEDRVIIADLGDDTLITVVDRGEILCRDVSGVIGEKDFLF